MERRDDALITAGVYLAALLGVLVSPYILAYYSGETVRLTIPRVSELLIAGAISVSVTAAADRISRKLDPARKDYAKAGRRRAWWRRVVLAFALGSFWSMVVTTVIGRAL